MNDWIIKDLSALFPAAQSLLLAAEAHSQILLAVVVVVVVAAICIYPKRTIQSLKRWRDIVIYALVAVIVAHTAMTYPTDVQSLMSRVTKVANHLGANSINWFHPIFVCLFWLGLIYILLQLRILPKGWPFKARPIRYYCFYPPLTASFWLGSILLCTKGYLFPSNPTLAPHPEWVAEALKAIMILWFVTAVAIPLLLLCCAQIKKFICGPCKRFINKSTESNTREDQNIIDWLHTETPSQLDKNLFDQDHELNRIHSFFHQSDDTGPRGKRIAIEGPRGIGKSTLAQKLYQELQKPKETAGKNKIASGRWLYVQVDAWGRSASHIEQQILELILGELAEQIDVLALNYIATRYHEAIKGLDGIGKYLHLANALNASTKEPLDELHGIFSLLNLNLLLVIEDPDRSTSHQSINQLISFIDRLNPIKYPKFNVVVNYSFGTDLQDKAEPTETHKIKQIELSALARAIEYQEKINGINCEKIIDNIKNIWKNRIEIEGSSKDKIIDLTNWESSEEFPAISWCKKNINTPRDFKTIMRKVDNLWQKGSLLGEIHLNDIIAFSTIQHLAPERTQEIVRAVNNGIKRTPPLEQIIYEQARTNANANANANASYFKIIEENSLTINKIINSPELRGLFGVSDNEIEINNLPKGEISRPQGIFDRKEAHLIAARERLFCLTNKRLDPNKKPIPTGEEPIPTDQALLREILTTSREPDWGSKNEKGLIHKMLSNRYHAKAVILFSYHLLKRNDAPKKQTEILTKEQIESLHNAAAEIISKKKPEEIQWISFFWAIYFLMPENLTIYLNQTLKLIKENDIVRAANLLCHITLISQHNDDTTKINPICDSLPKPPAEKLQRIGVDILHETIESWTTRDRLATQLASAKGIRIHYGGYNNRNLFESFRDAIAVCINCFDTTHMQDPKSRVNERVRAEKEAITSKEPVFLENLAELERLLWESNSKRNTNS